VAKSSLLYGVSLVAHGALAAGLFGLRPPKRVETVAISVSEAKKKEKAPEPAKVTSEPPRPIEPRAEAPRPTRANAATPKAAEAPPAAVPAARSPAFDALPDMGVMGNDGPGGVAVPPPQALAAAPVSSAHAPPAPKVLGPRPAADECTEPLVKPKRRLVSAPAYTAAAREAGVEGLVRVEVSVSTDGSVTGARVVSGLGHGLDEAALEAARRAAFEPATRCGKPVAATAVLPFRFNLTK
jgi:protein TonB